MTKALEWVINVNNLISRANTMTRIAIVGNLVSWAYASVWIIGVKDKVSWAKTFIRMVGIRHLIAWTTWASFASLHTILPNLLLFAFLFLLPFIAFFRAFLVLTFVTIEQYIFFWKTEIQIILRLGGWVIKNNKRLHGRKMIFFSLFKLIIISFFYMHNILYYDKKQSKVLDSLCPL